MKFCIFWNYLQNKEMIKTSKPFFPRSYIKLSPWFAFYLGCLMNLIFTWSDTSLNEPEELNPWAAKLFSTWNQAGKSCREKLQENQIKTRLSFNQSHPNGQKIRAWKPNKHIVTKYLGKKIKKFSHFHTITTNKSI